MSKNMQIRNVPDDVHEVYKRRAAAAGQSLQEYLLSDLTERAGRLTMDEAMARIAEHVKGSPITSEEVVAEIRRHRDAG